MDREQLNILLELSLYDNSDYILQPILLYMKRVAKAKSVQEYNIDVIEGIGYNAWSFVLFYVLGYKMVEIEGEPIFLVTPFGFKNYIVFWAKTDKEKEYIAMVVHMAIKLLNERDRPQYLPYKEIVKIAKHSDDVFLRRVREWKVFYEYIYKLK